MPYYVVKNRADDTVRLVSAPTPAQAFRHVVKDFAEVTQAKPEDLVRLLTNGVEAEKVEPQAGRGRPRKEEA